MSDTASATTTTSSSADLSTDELVVKILQVMLAAAASVGAVAGLSTVVLAALQAGITLLGQYDNIETVLEKLKSGDCVTTAEVTAALAKAIEADDALKAAIEARL